MVDPRVFGAPRTSGGDARGHGAADPVRCCPVRPFDIDCFRPLLPAQALLCAIAGRHRDAHTLAGWAAQLAHCHRSGTEPAVNARRAGLVHEIDGWIALMVPQHRDGARLHTETLGMVIDRMAAAQVRAMGLLMSHGAATADPCTHAAWVHLAELADGYDDLAVEVLTGRRRLPSLGDNRILPPAPATRA